MTTENNVTDIAKHLNEARNNRDRRPAKGSFANIAGKMINSAKVQIEYYSARNEAPEIEFLSVKNLGSPEEEEK